MYGHLVFSLSCPAFFRWELIFEPGAAECSSFLLMTVLFLPTSLRLFIPHHLFIWIFVSTDWKRKQVPRQDISRIFMCKSSSITLSVMRLHTEQCCINCIETGWPPRLSSPRVFPPHVTHTSSLRPYLFFLSPALSLTPAY